MKYSDNGSPVKRRRKNVSVQVSENIASKSFWNKHSYLVKDLGKFVEDVNKIKPEYIRSFNIDSQLMPSTWIVVRIDGCHFHRYMSLEVVFLTSRVSSFTYMIH